MNLNDPPLFTANPRSAPPPSFKRTYTYTLETSVIVMTVWGRGEGLREGGFLWLPTVMVTPLVLCPFCLEEGFERESLPEETMVDTLIAFLEPAQ